MGARHSTEPAPVSECFQPVGVFVARPGGTETLGQGLDGDELEGDGVLHAESLAGGLGVCTQGLVGIVVGSAEVGEVQLVAAEGFDAAIEVPGDVDCVSGLR